MHSTSRVPSDDAHKWLQEASALHTKIKQSRVSISKLFPQAEHLREPGELDPALSFRIGNFVNFDKQKLVPIEHIQRLLQQADGFKVEKGNVIFQELHKLNSRAQEIVRRAQAFSSAHSKHYLQAKQIFSDLQALGVWTEEATLVRKAVQLNHRLEIYLERRQEENLSTGFELTQQEAELLDPELSKRLATDPKETEKIISQIRHFRDRSHLERSDFEPLHELVKSISNSQVALQHSDEIKSIYQSMKWVFEVCEHLRIPLDKRKRLEVIVQELSKTVAELGDKVYIDLPLREVLQRVTDITETRPPLDHVIRNMKGLFWHHEANRLLERGKYSIDELTGLIHRAPKTGLNETAYNTLQRLNTTCAKALKWKDEVERVIRQTNKLKTDTKEKFGSHLVEALALIEGKIQECSQEYKDNSLSNFPGLDDLRQALDSAQKIVTTCRCIFKMNQKIKLDVKQFLEAKDYFKQCHSQRDENLFQHFKVLIKSFNESLKLVLNFYDQIKKGEHKATPDLYNTSFLEYAKNDLIPYTKLTESMAVIDPNFNLGEIGTTISRFESEFLIAEFNLKDVMKQYPPSELAKMNLVTIEKVIVTFEQLKQKMHVKLHSSSLEELARYEWLLQAHKNILMAQVPIESLEKLRDFSAVIKSQDQEVLSRLIQKIDQGNQLREEVKALIQSTTHTTVDNLRTAKQKLDACPLILRPLKRQIEQDYQKFQSLEEGFFEAKGQIGSQSHRMMEESLDYTSQSTPMKQNSAYRTTCKPYSLQKLKSLLKEFQLFPYRAPQIEAELSQAIAVNEKILMHALISRLDDQTCLEACKKLTSSTSNELSAALRIETDIEQYHSLNIRTTEVEYLIKNREIALKFIESNAQQIGQLEYKELLLLEKATLNSLDISLRFRFQEQVLQRKVDIIAKLESKPAEDDPVGLLNLEELKSLFQEAKSQPSLFKEDDLERLEQNIFQGEMYLTEMKKLSESSLHKASKVIFNYLDMTSEVESLIQSLAGSKQAQQEDKSAKEMKAEPLEPTHPEPIPIQASTGPLIAPPPQEIPRQQPVQQPHVKLLPPKQTYEPRPPSSSPTGHPALPGTMHIPSLVHELSDHPIQRMPLHLKPPPVPQSSKSGGNFLLEELAEKVVHYNVVGPHVQNPLQAPIKPPFKRETLPPHKFGASDMQHAKPQREFSAGQSLLDTLTSVYNPPTAKPFEKEYQGHKIPSPVPVKRRFRDTSQRGEFSSPQDLKWGEPYKPLRLDPRQDSLPQNGQMNRLMDKPGSVTPPRRQAPFPEHTKEPLEKDTLNTRAPAAKAQLQSDNGLQLTKVIQNNRDIGSSALHDKTLLKETRLANRRSIRRQLHKFFPGLSILEGENHAINVEKAVYSASKSALHEYQVRIEDYIRLLQKAGLKPFLLDLIISVPLSSSVVSYIMQDESEAYFGLQDEKQGRVYLKNVMDRIAQLKPLSDGHEPTFNGTGTRAHLSPPPSERDDKSPQKYAGVETLPLVLNNLQKELFVFEDPHTSKSVATDATNINDPRLRREAPRDDPNSSTAPLNQLLQEVFLGKRPKLSAPSADIGFSEEEVLLMSRGAGNPLGRSHLHHSAVVMPVGRLTKPSEDDISIIDDDSSEELEEPPKNFHLPPQNHTGGTETRGSARLGSSGASLPHAGTQEDRIAGIMTAEARLPPANHFPAANSRGQKMLEETIKDDANTQGDKMMSFQAFLASEFYKGFGVGSEIGQSDSKTSGVECLDDIRFPMDQSYLLDFQSPSKARKGGQGILSLDKDPLSPMAKAGMVSANLKEDKPFLAHQDATIQKVAERMPAIDAHQPNEPVASVTIGGGPKSLDNKYPVQHQLDAHQMPHFQDDAEGGSAGEEHSAEAQIVEERKIGPNTTLFSGTIKFLDPKKAIPEVSLSFVSLSEEAQETSVSAAVLDHLQTDITLCFGETISTQAFAEIWAQANRERSKAVQGFVLTDVKKNRALFDVKSQVARALSTKTAEGKSGREEQTTPGSLVFKCDVGTQVSLFASERNTQIQLYLFSKDNPLLPQELRGLAVPANHEFCWLLVYQ